MDFCCYVNSKSISKHLRDIKYDFNSKEAAWLIWQCISISLEEKHNAWKQLMEEMSDYDLGERFDYLPNNSLFELIKRNIKYHKEQYDLFLKKEDDAIYQYSFYCTDDSSWCEDYYGVYKSLDECWKLLEEDMDLGIELIHIRKRYISTNKIIEVRYTPSRVVMDIFSTCMDEAYAIEEGFDCMWFDFPVPFEQGDILTPIHLQGPVYRWSEMGPFVMDNITPWQTELNERVKNSTHGDTSDMLAWGYFLDPDGRIYHEGTDYNYMNLDYYNGPFDGPRRLLIAISNYIKGKIRLELLLCAYRKINMDEAGYDVMLYNWFIEDERRLAGLE